MRVGKKMGPLPTSVSALLCVVSLLCLHGGVVGNGYMKYNTGAGIVDDKLNVHLVPHTHDDVGWLKTVDEYYIGSNNSIQGACVEDILDSVIMSLSRDASRKFVYVEMAFFYRWWETQSSAIQQQVRGLVDAGQLEFVNGGWCMHDEATTHYIDMIDQTTLGHELIKSQFNKTPRAGWQIDPFGHSAVQAYLLGVELGFESLHFARIDYQDRQVRSQNKTLEVLWRGSSTFGASNQIFANTFPVHYSPPGGFHFEVNDVFVPVQDNPMLFDYNVQQRVDDFVNAALTQAEVTQSNHIMWTMGDDFQYQYAESWFKQMDKLIHYVNQDGRVNALYSTPSIYADAKLNSNISWPLKTDDYFPYADSQNAYWTGYYSSRAAFKRYVRALSGYYLAARQLEFRVGKNSTGPNTYSLGDALGLAQHHDAVSGTAKQHTTDDYAKRLAIGASEAEAVVNSALSCLVSSNSSNQCSSPGLPLSQCQLLNISYCPPTEANIPSGKNLVVVVYNPLGLNRTEIIKIPVNDTNLLVQDSAGNTVEAQFVELDDVTRSLRDFYVEAYTGVSPPPAPKYWLYFRVSVPPLDWNTYFISKSSKKGNKRNAYVSELIVPEDETITVGPGNLKLSFSSSSGQLVRMSNSKTGVDIPVQQNYLWYASSTGNSDPQSSGAYIFRPKDSSPTVVSSSVTIKVIRGPLVDEVHQVFGSWIYQVTRVYKEKDHAEFEFTIGEIPIDDGVGKEVITQLTTNLGTNKVFYTDANGRDFLKRVRDHRNDWPLQVTQPVAGNYYPINLGIVIEDDNSEFSVLVDRATGGSSINDGQVELMLHRRILNDDGRGVGEPLNETVCVANTCQGLTVRGNYFSTVNKLGAGARWRRTTGQEIYSPLVVAYAQEDSGNWRTSHTTKVTPSDPNNSLPPNVALITQQVLNDGNVLLRLAHLYEAGEDAEYSAPAEVDLNDLFPGKTIVSIKEMSLSANQLKSEMKTKTWKVEGGNQGKEAAPKQIRGAPLDPSAPVVELGPMEIRTFILEF